MASTSTSTSTSSKPLSPGQSIRAPPAGVVRRTALITGSSAGIGRAIARRLAAEGFDLGLTHMPSENVEHVHAHARKIAEQYGVAVTSFETDLFYPDAACPKLLADFLAQFKRIDVLVNCAGVSCFNAHDVHDFPGDAADTLQKVRDGFNINFNAPFLLSQGAVRAMLQQSPPDSAAPDHADPDEPALEHNFYTSAWGVGRIINITSVHARKPYAGSSIYVSSKHALHGLTTTMAVELARKGITVNSVEPGMIATGMNFMSAQDALSPERAQPNLPIPRPGMPAEVAGAIAYIVSESGRYMTGESITVDGGFCSLANPHFYDGGLNNGDKATYKGDV